MSWKINPMIDLKIQYITQQGVVRSSETYTSLFTFYKEVSKLTNLHTVPDTFKVCFVNEDILTIISPDDLIVELDAIVLKKYKELLEELPSEIEQKEATVLTLLLDKQKILKYCSDRSKKFFELSGVVGIKDSKNDVYYGSDSTELSSNTVLYLNRSLDKIYSVSTNTKISKVFITLEDVEYIDVILLSGHFEPEYCFSVLHKTKYREVYDNLIKLQG